MARLCVHARAHRNEHTRRSCRRRRLCAKWYRRIVCPTTTTRSLRRRRRPRAMCCWSPHPRVCYEYKSNVFLYAVACLCFTFYSVLVARSLGRVGECVSKRDLVAELMSRVC